MKWSICPTCTYNPGRGHWCTAAQRHATAHPKRCPEFRGSRDAKHVATLRRMALDELHAGNQARYAALLNVAHDAAEAVRE